MSGIEQNNPLAMSAVETEIDEKALYLGGANNDGIDSLKAEAMVAEQADHQESLWQGLRRHPQAVWWTFVMSLLVIMEAYDSDMWGSLIALPAFRERFGVYVNATSGYQLTAAWSSALSFAATIGAFTGILIAGQIVGHLGYRYTSFIGLGLLSAAIFFLFFGTSLPLLFLGELFCGIPWGFFMCIGPAYASEVAPLSLRAACTLWIQACWCIGHFIEAGVVYGTENLNNEWSYKIPFAIQWAWPIPLAILVFLAPESPWWLVRRSRMEEAEKVINRLGVTAGSTAKARLSEISRTVEIERQQTEGATYADCFRGTNWRRTMIACVIFAAQNYTGYTLAGNSTYFFEQAGFPTSQAFALTLGSVAIQLSAVFMCAGVTSYVGRRTIYISGLITTLILLLIIGIIACVPVTTAGRWIQAVATIAAVVLYGATIGPITYSIIAEISSVKLRAKTVALSRAFYYATTIPSTYIGNYSINASAWNMKGKAAFIWIGTCLCVLVWSWFCLPEVRGRSYRELDILFGRKIPARKFASVEIAPDEEE